MNVVESINQYDVNNVFFCDPMKNNVMEDGVFIRILYSTHLFTLNGVYLSLSVNITSIEKYYNKYKIFFDKNVHSDLISQIYKIESGILQKSNITNKVQQYKIYDQLKNGNIKIFADLNQTNANYGANSNNSQTFLLKISGIWETELNYGVTYKFIRVQD